MCIGSGTAFIMNS